MQQYVQKSSTTIFPDNCLFKLRGGELNQSLPSGKFGAFSFSACLSTRSICDFSCLTNPGNSLLRSGNVFASALEAKIHVNTKKIIDLVNWWIDQYAQLLRFLIT